MDLEDPMSELRDFLYLDSGKLYSFVSQIQGGLIDQISQTTKQLGGLSAGLNVGITHLGGKIDASKGKESESHQVLQLTDPAYFNILYQYLESEKAITDISDTDIEFCNKLDVRHFVEIRGIAEPPIVEAWIDRVEQLFGFLERNVKIFSKVTRKDRRNQSSTLSPMQLREFRNILDLLYDFMRLGRIDPGKQYIKVTPARQLITIWIGLIPQFVISPLNTTLPTDVTVFGRVERVLMSGDVVKIVDISQFSQATGVDQLLEILNGFSPFLGGKDIRREEFEAISPSVFITPIAVYR